MNGRACRPQRWIAAITFCLVRSLEADAVLESAELSRGFTTLLLRLSETVNASSTGCESLLSAASVQKIGALAQCQWLLGGTVLEVTLGEQPDIQVGDSVALLPSLGAALEGTVSAAEPSPWPLAVLEIRPPVVQLCSLLGVTVDASLSTGGAGRPLTAAWSSDVQEVQDYLSSQTALTFDLPAGVVASAVQSALAANASLTRVPLAIGLTSTNWLGLMNVSSAALEVEVSDVQLPVLEPTSPSSQSIFSNESVSFSVATRNPDAATCTAVSSEGISVSWEYRTDASQTWLPLVNASLEDGLRTPWQLRFDAFRFAPSTSHQLRASVSLPFAGTGQAQQAQHVFQLDVKPSAPLVAVVTGPAVVSETCDLVLDASQSFDPDSATAPVRYFWSCAANDTAFNCHTLSNFATVTWAKTDGEGASGSTLRVAAGQLVAGLYTFNVTVIRSADRTSFSLASWMVEVRQAASVPIRLSVPWIANQLVSSQLLGQLPACRAVLSVGNGCGMVPSAQWRWALVKHASPSTILTYLESTQGNLSEPGDIAVSATTFPSSYLVPGDVYAFALLELGTAQPQDLAEAETLGLQFAQSVPFIADGPPTGGSVACLPAVGVAASTEFLLSTSLWYDEDLPGAVYRFYRFPLTAGLSLVADGSSFSVSGIFQRPSVDWRNKNRSAFWVKSGGVYLGEGRLSSMQLYLPPGEHMLAAVVEDELGAVSSSWFVGPLVQAGDSSSAGAALDGALRLGDAQTILNTLAASSFSVSDDRSREAAALTSALASMDLSGLELSSMNAVVVELLRAASPSAAATISDVIMSLLDLVVSPDSSLDYLLESVLMIKLAYAPEATWRTERLTALTSKFGDAALAGSPFGQERRLRSLAHLPDNMGLEVAAKDHRNYEASTFGISVEGFTKGGLGELRRLAEVGEASCGAITAQVTTWWHSNPYVWPNISDDGMGQYVTNTTTVAVLELRRCGTVFNISGGFAFAMSRPGFPTEAPPEGYAFQPACVWLDLAALEWTTRGLVRRMEISGPDDLICTFDLEESELVVAAVVYRPELVPVEEEPPSILLIIVAIIIFLICMAGLAYANMKPKKQEEAEDEEAPGQPSAKVAPEPEPAATKMTEPGPDGSPPAEATEPAPAEPAPTESSPSGPGPAPGTAPGPAPGPAPDTAGTELPTSSHAPELPPLPSATSVPSRAADPGSPAEALVPKPQLDTAAPIDAPVAPEFQTFAEGFKKSELPTAGEEAPLPPSCPEEPN